MGTAASTVCGCTTQMVELETRTVVWTTPSFVSMIVTMSTQVPKRTALKKILIVFSNNFTLSQPPCPLCVLMPLVVLTTSMRGKHSKLTLTSPWTTRPLK